MTVLIRMNDETIDAYSMRADKEIYRLTDLVKEMRKGNTEQREKIERYETRIINTTSALENEKAYTTKYRQEAEKLEEKLKDTESLVDSLRGSIEARDEVIADLKTKLAEYQEAGPQFLYRPTDATEALSKEIDKLKDKIQRLKAGNSKLYLRIQELNKPNHPLFSKLMDDAQAEIEELKTTKVSHELLLLKFRIIVADLTMQLYNSKEAKFQSDRL